MRISGHFSVARKKKKETKTDREKKKKYRTVTQGWKFRNIE
jgi:hypothetical protein